MSFEVVPKNEIPKVIAAAKEHRCVSCYKDVVPYDGGLYCYECDPRPTSTEASHE